MKICIYGASSPLIKDIYIEEGELLGALMAKHGHEMVFGGGGAGLMGAVARGIHKENGKMTSVVPTFFNVDGILYEGADQVIYTETMRERKQKMEEISDAFIVTPGGIGTLDEFFEIFTLRSLSRHLKPIAIFNTNGFYNGLINVLNKGIEDGFIDKNIKDYIFVSKSADDILGYIEKKVEQIKF